MLAVSSTRSAWNRALTWWLSREVLRDGHVLRGGHAPPWFTCHLGSMFMRTCQWVWPGIPRCRRQCLGISWRFRRLLRDLRLSRFRTWQTADGKRQRAKNLKKTSSLALRSTKSLAKAIKKKAAKEMNLTLHLSIRWLQKAGTLWLVGRACGPAMRNGKTPHFNATHDDHQDTGHFRTLDMLVAQQTCNGNTLQLSSAASPETKAWRAWLFIAYSDERWRINRGYTIIDTEQSGVQNKTKGKVQWNSDMSDTQVNAGTWVDEEDIAMESVSQTVQRSCTEWVWKRM